MIRKRFLSRFLVLFLLFNIVDLIPTNENDDPLLIEISWDKIFYLVHTIPSVLVPANLSTIFSNR